MYIIIINYIYISIYICINNINPSILIYIYVILILDKIKLNNNIDLYMILTRYYLTRNRGRDSIKWSRISVMSSMMLLVL